jgi:hypothetical protein
MWQEKDRLYWRIAQTNRQTGYKTNQTCNEVKTEYLLIITPDAVSSIAVLRLILYINRDWVGSASE